MPGNQGGQMRKFSIVVGLMLLCGVARAEDVSIIDGLKKFPGVKQGLAFSIDDAKVNYLATVDVMKLKGFNLEAGVATDSEKTGTKAVAVLSYDLFNAKKAGIDVPVLDLIDIRPGIWAGYGRIEGFQDSQLKGEGTWGLSVTALSLKF
jgi:hypothetical protein